MTTNWHIVQSHQSQYVLQRSSCVAEYRNPVRWLNAHAMICEKEPITGRILAYFGLFRILGHGYKDPSESHRYRWTIMSYLRSPLLLFDLTLDKIKLYYLQPF